MKWNTEFEYSVFFLLTPYFTWLKIKVLLNNFGSLNKNMSLMILKKTLTNDNCNYIISVHK